MMQLPELVSISIVRKPDGQWHCIAATYFASYCSAFDTIQEVTAALAEWLNAAKWTSDETA